MKAAVLHHSVNRPGGETTVALQIIDSLQDIGYDVKLISVERLNNDDVSTGYGKKIKARNPRYLLPFSIGCFGLYQRFLTGISSLGLQDVDLIINTNGTVLPLRIPKGVPSLIYVHFPTALVNFPSASFNNDKYQKSLFWKIYFTPYRFIASILTKDALFRSSTVLVNSYFTKYVLKKIYPELHPEVLYPCVELERFSAAYNSSLRKSQVIVISRFSPEKQVENAIQVAKILDDVEFEVVGSLHSTNHGYFRSLSKMIKAYGLEARIRLRPNISFKELVEAMSVSKIYLHTTFGEHFGVSVIEAMAAGLIPVVPSIGGCSEIVPLEYQYNKIEEAASSISKFMHEYDEDKRKQIYQIAQKFSFISFREELKRLIRDTRSKYEHAATTKKSRF